MDTSPAPVTPRPDDHDGDIEVVAGVEFTHRFVEVDGSRYHAVVAGPPGARPVVFLHGLPECWYAWHHQMVALAPERLVVAVELKGYGQSEKRPDTSYRFDDMAVEVMGVLDQLGVAEFDLVGQDRGAVLADNLFGVDGAVERIGRYARCSRASPRPTASHVRHTS